MGHYKRTKMVPSIWREGMLWINKDVQAEQVLNKSPDLIVAVIQLLE